MGYCYAEVDGRHVLCCDICGDHGGVRRVRCPYGYCQATAACPKCRKEHKTEFSKARHADCKVRSAEFHARECEQQRLLDAGLAVRCSALSTDDGRVHVLFRYKEGRTIGLYMSNETYDAITLLTPACTHHYQAIGKCEEAPGEFADGRVTKQIVVGE